MDGKKEDWIVEEERCDCLDIYKRKMVTLLDWISYLFIFIELCVPLKNRKQRR